MNTLELEQMAKECWLEHVEKNGLPQGIPINPDEIYKDDGWKGWVDWLGWQNIEMN